MKDKFEEDLDLDSSIEETDSEIISDDDIEESDEHENDVDEERWIPKWKRSNCPKSDTGHNAIKNKTAARFGRTEYVCEYCGKKDWTVSELEYIADQILREDSNAELCRICWESDKDSLPYGKETGHVEWQLQLDEEDNVIINEQGDAVYVGFPEFVCDKGHRWYKGEGPRRNINGKNPILFESHIYNRKRREIYAVDGVIDPAYNMDRWGKRPEHLMYNRSHPTGRKTNDATQRARGAG